MCSLCVEELEIPEIVVSTLSLRNLIMRLGLPSMDNIRELDCVLNKEHWNIISDNVPRKGQSESFDAILSPYQLPSSV
jgi:hypothetical protein